MRKFCTGVLLLVFWAQTARCVGLTWPADQFLPTFSTPTTLDCIDISSASGAEVDLFASLEGIVNRTEPRIACVSSGNEEGEFTWLALHHLPFELMNGYSVLLAFETNVTGLVVTDPNQPDTLNLATTIAGVKDELICDPSLLSVLTNAPYSLPVKDDLRGMFSNKYEVYGYLYTNYWPFCTHRIIAGMETNGYGALRDYLVAVKAAVVWLDPGSAADANALAPFASGMAPVGGVYMGWWPSEGNGLTWIANYGIPVIASDWFDNGSLFGGVASPISVKPIPSPPPLQNRVYICLILSDGDNVQYMQHHMYALWQNASRGQVPIGWTVQPLAAEFDPGMLNYYWSTATTNDCFVSGPSGAGYTHIEDWGAGNVENYARASDSCLRRSGIQNITVWDTVSSGAGNIYATNCPTLLGIFDQDGGYYTTHDGTLPVVGLPGSANYASAASYMIYGITNTAAGWNGSSPMFIAVQGSAWDVTPADCQTVANALDPTKYVVVRPDQLFLLYQEESGQGKGGASPFLATQPSSQLAIAGSNATFSVTAGGSGPMAYKWQINGSNISGATNSTLVKTDVQVSDTGSYQVVVTNNYGAITSSIAVLTFGNQPLGFNGDGMDWTVGQNGIYPYSTPAFYGNVLTLTDGANGESVGAFFGSPQYIGAFKAAFTYQAGGNEAADGATFCVQNDSRGASALGAGGGALAVGGTTPISPSIELELNLYTGNNQSAGYAVLTDGLTGAAGANGNYLAPGNVQINSGDPIAITILYQAGWMTLTFTDAVDRASFTTNFAVNVPAIIGTNTAYVGFTGADGGANSIQSISHFSFESLPAPGIEAGDGNVIISWPGAAPGFTLQQTADIATGHWTDVTNAPSLVNGQQQVSVSSATDMFYRLVLLSGF